MKRFLLLAVCAISLFGIAPSQADPVCASGAGSEACVEAPQYSYEACAWNNGVGTHNQVCVDTNNDAWNDGYVYGYGTVTDGTDYYISNETNDGYISLYDYLAVMCLQGWVSLDDPDFGGGTC